MKLYQPLKGILKKRPKGIITQYFGEFVEGYRKISGTEGHNGIDLATFHGDNVYAAHKGEVINVKKDKWGYGKNITLLGDLKDGKHICTIYAHLHEIFVEIGDKVSEGQRIALEGNSGYVVGEYDGTHLHFGVYEYCPPVAGTYQLSYPNGKAFTVLNYNNKMKGALNPCDFLGCEMPETKPMTKEKLFQIFHEILLREPTTEEEQKYINQEEQVVRLSIGKSPERKNIIKVINFARKLGLIKKV